MAFDSSSDPAPASVSLPVQTIRFGQGEDRPEAPEYPRQIRRERHKGAVGEMFSKTPSHPPSQSRPRKQIPIRGDEQIANEAQLRPVPTGSRRITRSNGVWTALQLEDYRLDFRINIKAPPYGRVAYAVGYILSERDQTGLILKVGSDNLAKIQLNQWEIHRRVNPATVETDRDMLAGVELQAGLNVLVFKVVSSHLVAEQAWTVTVLHRIAKHLLSADGFVILTP